MNGNGMSNAEAKRLICQKCSEYVTCKGHCVPMNVLMNGESHVLNLLIAEHRCEDYESELDAVRVGAMISRVADRFVE